MGRPRKYLTLEDKLEAHRQAAKRYYDANKEACQERNQVYYQKNQEKICAHKKEVYHAHKSVQVV